MSRAKTQAPESVNVADKQSHSVVGSAGALTRLNKIRMGQAFAFDAGGAVYVKTRGGYRRGCGGPLHACAPHAQVYALEYV